MKLLGPIAVLLTCCLIGSLLTIDPVFGIRFTVSPSLPYKVFISRSCTHIVKNQYVSFEHPQSNILLAKQVIGIAGDRISIQENQICINNQVYGNILERSKSGQHLHPIAEGIIPEGYLFVYAPHPDSFDSRYQEFGLVNQKHFKESLWPLL